MLGKLSMAAVGIAALSLAVAASRLAGAATEAGPNLANNEGLYVNMKTFKVVRGMAKGDPQAQITKLGARPVKDGAIIFRANDRLYIVDAVPGGGEMDLMFEGAFAPPG
jgi:hypothetical protein